MARIPLYKTLETEMLRRIGAGDWPQGHRLPNEFVLAGEFGVSQGTMRRALMSLEAAGHLTRKPGRGTIVATPSETPSPAPAATPVTPALHLTDATGAPLSFDVFRSRAATRGAAEDEATLFGQTRIATLERTLKSNGTRVALDTVAIPEIHAPQIPEDAPLDLPALAAQLDLPMATTRDTLTAAVTTMAQSVALSTDRHTALLVLTRTAFTQGGQAIARQTRQLIAEGIIAHPAESR